MADTAQSPVVETRLTAPFEAMLLASGCGDSDFRSHMAHMGVSKIMGGDSLYENMDGEHGKPREHGG